MFSTRVVADFSVVQYNDSFWGGGKGRERLSDRLRWRRDADRNHPAHSSFHTAHIPHNAFGKDERLGAAKERHSVTDHPQRKKQRIQLTVGSALYLRSSPHCAMDFGKSFVPPRGKSLAPCRLPLSRMQRREGDLFLCFFLVDSAHLPSIWKICFQDLFGKATLLCV